MKGATYESDPFSRIPSVGRHSLWAGRRLLVIGEVITFPGKWSSYIPHHHPQPECTTYRFNRPEGFDCAFIGDQAYKITDHSLAAIPGGRVHPQAAAPGYAIYYCWMIRPISGC